MPVITRTNRRQVSGVKIINATHCYLVVNINTERAVLVVRACGDCHCVVIVLLVMVDLLWSNSIVKCFKRNCHVRQLFPSPLPDNAHHRT